MAIPPPAPEGGPEPPLGADAVQDPNNPVPPFEDDVPEDDYKVRNPMSGKECRNFCMEACVTLTKCGDIIDQEKAECQENCPNMCDTEKISFEIKACLEKKGGCRKLKTCFSETEERIRIKP